MAKNVEIGLGNLIVFVVLGLCLILTIGLISGFTKNTTCPQTFTSPATKPNPVTGASLTVPSLTSRVNPVTSPTTAFAPSEFRLSSNVKSVRTEILLRTYFDPYGSKQKVDEEKYTGEVSLVFDLAQASNRIVFHMDLSVRLTDPNIQFTNEINNQNIAVQSHNYLRNQLYEIVLASTLSVGTYRIFLKFEGRTSPNGFYKINYLEYFTDR